MTEDALAPRAIYEGLASGAAQRMDEISFRSFYQETAPALRAYISRSCGSRDLADDIMQDSFLRFLRTAPADMDERAMRGYLYRTAHSLMVDHWRRQNREQRWSLQALFRREAVEPLEDVSDMTSVFRRLKPLQRSLLWLAYVEELDHREIACATGIKEKSVRVLLFRARKALAGMLDHAGLGRK